MQPRASAVAASAAAASPPPAPAAPSWPALPPPVGPAAAAAAPPLPPRLAALDPSVAVKINLKDCLACSGCVTSAEAVLLESQSAGEMMAKLGDPSAAVVVSISPQSRAALAVVLGITPIQVLRRLTGWLKSLGARYGT